MQLFNAMICHKIRRERTDSFLIRYKMKLILKQRVNTNPGLFDYQIPVTFCCYIVRHWLKENIKNIKKVKLTKPKRHDGKNQLSQRKSLQKLLAQSLLSNRLVILVNSLSDRKRFLCILLPLWFPSLQPSTGTNIQDQVAAQQVCGEQIKGKRTWELEGAVGRWGAAGKVKRSSSRRAHREF